MYTYFPFLQTGEKVQKLQKLQKIIKHSNFFFEEFPHKTLLITPIFKNLLEPERTDWPFHFSSGWCSYKTRSLSSSCVIRSVGSEHKSTKTLASAETEPFPWEILSLHFHKWLPIIWGYFWGGHIRGGSDGAGDRWSAVCIKRHTSFIYWTLLIKRWLKKAISR